MFSIKGPPHLSLPFVDVIDALSAIGSADGLANERILGLRVEDHDKLVVKTGEVPAALTGGGHILRVERTQEGWRITAVDDWVT